ncbi:M24 family metallopeptidase [Cytobacillus sp. FJAT-54145]|uniref:M24 family metallopeptidase n=1 Tax=Cytobacillus spartinae TaxID=3299023 RepID=A0ABW6KJ03_9BACI
MNKRLSNLMEWMKQEEIDLCFLTSSDSVFYFSGFHSDPHERLLGLAVFQDSEPFLVCPAMEKEDVKNAGWTNEIVGHGDTDNAWELVNQAITKRLNSVSKIGIEKEHLNVERFEEISKYFPKASFIPAEQKIRKLRLVKDEKELSIIKEACALADFAIEVGCSEIAEGKTELDVLAAIEFELKKKGVNEMSFSTMVLTGVNAASPHGTPGLTKMQKGDLVLFDLGVVWNGYCSDITRTVAFGDINDKQREIYETVLKAQLAALEVSKPGVTCAEVDSTARNIIREAGYGEYFPHRLGHGLGISVHEFPSLTETNPLPLEKGMVFTIEPGIYVPGVAGVRIEDDVVVTDNGLEILTKFPKELQVI